MQTKKTLIHGVDYILLYAKKEDLTDFYTLPKENEIRLREYDDEIDTKPFSSFLGKVFNFGMGFLKLAEFASDGVLVLNTFLLGEQEQTDLRIRLETEGIKYKFIYYGKDDWTYSTLLEMYRRKAYPNFNPRYFTDRDVYFGTDDPDKGKRGILNFLFGWLT